MSAAREEILAQLERAQPPANPRPIAMSTPSMPPDPIATLRDRIVDAGGSLQTVERNGWVEQVEWPVDRSSFEHVYSSVSAIPMQGDAISAKTDHELERLDLCVLSAEFAVVENGAVWHRPTTTRERAAALLATHLMITVESDELVATLHQAYERIELEPNEFGWFLCGPSKTADIEQSLVFGAHGPCTMSLILIRD